MICLRPSVVIFDDGGELDIITIKYLRKGGEAMNDKSEKKFVFDKYFKNRRKSDANTKAAIKNDIEKIYSQFPFSKGNSTSVVNDSVVEEKYEEILEKITPKLREKYPEGNNAQDDVTFSNDMIDASVDVMASDICKKLKEIHRTK